MGRNPETSREQALHAGQQALEKLLEASSFLQSAGNWGIVDMFGGTWISTLQKHKRMKKAKRVLDEAAEYLGFFETELHQLDAFRDINLKTKDFLGKSDLFLDGLIADAVMQSRIRKAQEQVDDAVAVVDQLVSSLYEKGE